MLDDLKQRLLQKTSLNPNQKPTLKLAKTLVFILSISIFLCYTIYFNNISLLQENKVNLKYGPYLPTTNNALISNSLVNNKDEKTYLNTGNNKIVSTNSKSIIDEINLANLLNNNASINYMGNNTNDGCFCNGENFCFPGINENGRKQNGRKFDCSFYESLWINGLLDQDAATTPNDYDKLDDSWEPIFVTSASNDHFPEVRVLIKSIKDYYPESKVIIYDLGLNVSYVKEIRSWCGVEYQKFDFNKYPKHVQNLMNYTFKLITLEVLKNYKTFFYFDTSIRVGGRNLLHFLKGVKNGTILPFSTHNKALHSVFATTDKRMYEYFPLPKIIAHMEEMQSGFQFISDSPYTRHIMKWWYLCANTEDCISPQGAVNSCSQIIKNYDLKRTYANCHRFDQAYWNIAVLEYLFGEKRGALKMEYAEQDWTELNENLIAEVEHKRLKAMEPFFELVVVKREEKMKNTLIIECPYNKTK